MEKSKWPWKRKSSPVESHSSGSSSSHSDKDGDEQEIRSQPCQNGEDSMNETAKCLAEKLSAALLNVGAKEEFIKQHAKVAGEAVTGWEKAENEVSTMKQQLDAAVQQNLDLQAKADSKTAAAASVNPKASIIFETLAKENTFLKHELVSCYKELEAVTYERDLCVQAAETASKLHLEAVRKIAKLEAENRRLQLLDWKLSPSNNTKGVAPSYFYADSFTDSHSDCGERMNTADNVELKETEKNSLDMWASALIAELDKFKNEKLSSKNLTPHPLEISMMDDFLEMERLAALPDTRSNTSMLSSSGSPCAESLSPDNPLNSEADSDSIVRRMAELEKKLEKVDMEKTQLQIAFVESQASLAEAESKLEELQKTLTAANEEKLLLEHQLVAKGQEARSLSATADVLKIKIEKEQNLSSDLMIKHKELENELTATKDHESVIQQKENSVDEAMRRQEDLAVAADKLADCQKTIASLGRQLKSLATLEDFLIDT